jgi:hypothetical protein
MNYLSLRRMSEDMINAYGEDVSFKIKLDTYRNPFSGAEDSSDVTVKVKGLQQNVSDFVVDYSNVKTGDKTIMIPAGYGIPYLGSEILIGNQLHRVLSVTAESPAGYDIYYNVKARSYALTEDVDTITFALAEMELGSLVVDPNRLETPQWMVVGQNHFKTGQTTLMTWHCITDAEPFKGSSGNWNTSPWSETWIRRYLFNNFRNTLSANLIKNLQPFTVQTTGQRTVDTITILSNHEVGFEKKPGTDNGDPLDYFLTEGSDREAANALRIASFENQNIAYWTREAGGVGSDGAYATLNPNYGHGLRPVINLLSGLEAKYNAAGEFELDLP